MGLPDVGLTETISFSRCLSDRSAAQVVVRDRLAAHALGARGTPTFLINHLKVAGYRGAEQLNALVAAELKGTENRQADLGGGR